MGGEPQMPPLAHRLMWFAGLWIGGVSTVALISLALRFWIVSP